MYPRKHKNVEVFINFEYLALCSSASSAPAIRLASPLGEVLMPPAGCANGGFGIPEG
ncbi:hypothetical protein H6H03_15915 [Nostoc paludosum FACHB-159]|uniref:Uncharacterized protein n=1 Tax=Nostoc paludosum FACHB-159 TaxID=2692908 RepID=A0ABR8K795_9NOSO|nr:hypothetical protein [Nostoc paludosum FACHB-159]